MSDRLRRAHARSAAPRPASLAAAALAVLCLSALAPRAAVRAQTAPASPAPAAPAAVDHLVILSTTDVKGKTGPCGCHTPKGGLSRRAAFADSVRAENAQLLIVDNGGFFPEQPDYEPDAAFMVEAMQQVGVQVAGLGDRELIYGPAFLRATLARAKFPAVCANLMDARTNRPFVKPWVILNVGGHKAGVFGLIGAFGGAGRGPDSLGWIRRAADSLTVSDATDAARKAVAEMRRGGATVVVLLSSLGKTETEDLVAAVDGVDVAIAGRNVPVLERGRQIKSTMVEYGGEQSQYIGRVDLGLDASGHAVNAKGETFMLGPEVGEHPGVLAMVKAFEESFNARLRRLEQERAAKGSPTAAPATPAATTH